MYRILYKCPCAGLFFLYYPLPALYRSKSYSDYHRTAGSRYAFQHHAAELSFSIYVQKQPTKHITYCQDSAKDIASSLIAHYHLSITNYPLFSGGILVNTYKLVVQTIQNGKITGNASLSVGANSTMEARQKFMAAHPPTATKKYKIVACAKQ